MIAEVCGILSCHPGDKRWICEQLGKLPASMRAKVAGKYSSVYDDICAENAGKISAESMARREANTRLRGLVDRYGAAAHGKVISPGE